VRPNFAYQKIKNLPPLSGKIRAQVQKDQSFSTPYGQFRHMHYPHAFSSNPVLDLILSRRLPGRGTMDTINVATSPFTGSDKAVNQANMRMVVSFGPEGGLWSTDTGQSGHFMAGHYFDLKGSLPGPLRGGADFF
jgi:hypothetical protein